MLDEFSATKLDTEAKPKEKEPTKEQAESFSEDDFAKQLQADMANLLGEFDKSVSPSNKSTDIQILTLKSPKCKPNSKP